MKQKVPISVIIPCHNSERFIAETIGSVQAQTVEVEEILVVDNNCTDLTAEIAKNLGARVLKRKKVGAPAARNKAIVAATGEWIALLDSDDWWLPEHLEYLWEAVHVFPQSRIAFSYLNTFNQFVNQEIINEEASTILPRENLTTATVRDAEAVCCERMTGDLLEYFTICLSNSLFHREAFSLGGLFDEALPFSEDIELTSRLMAKFPTVMVRKPLCFYRVYRDTISLEQERRWKYIELAIEKMRKNPADYPPGCDEFYAAHLKARFINQGFYLARNRHFEIESKKKDA